MAPEIRFRRSRTQQAAYTQLPQRQRVDIFKLGRPRLIIHAYTYIYTYVSLHINIESAIRLRCRRIQRGVCTRLPKLPTDDSCRLSQPPPIMNLYTYLYIRKYLNLCHLQFAFVPRIQREVCIQPPQDPQLRVYGLSRGVTPHVYAYIYTYVSLHLYIAIAPAIRSHRPQIQPEACVQLPQALRRFIQARMSRP